MGILDDAKDKMHEKKGEMKGRADSTELDDKAKAEFEKRRAERAESSNQTDDTMTA